MSLKDELLELPLHVVENVLSCLGGDRRTLLRCRLVSRKMNNIIFSESLGFMWERMEFLQLGYADKGCDQENRDKAQVSPQKSFLLFLENVADYVTHLWFCTRFEVPVLDLQSLPHLPALKILDLSCNDWLSAPHLQEIAQKCDVIDVNLRFCPNLCHSALAVMSSNWTLMESIDIRQCVRLTDDHGLVSQFHDTLVALKKYNAGWCDGITDASVLRLLNRDGAAERLTELRLCAWHLTNAALTSIATCSNMEFLCLSSCYNLTDAALSPLKNLAQLKHLHLKSGLHLTAVALEDFFQNASFQLQHLKLEALSGMNDRAMEHVLLRNLGLKSLGLYRCDNVSDFGLQHLRGLSQLRLLLIQRVKGVTSAIFDFDADMLPELMFVHLVHTGISEADVDAIREKLPHVADHMDQLEKVEGRCCISNGL